MKKLGMIGVALAGVLLLAGCGEAAQTPENADGASASRTEEMTPPPLVAETPAAPSATEAETQFVAYVRENLRPTNVVPNATDEQLLSAGKDGCAQIIAEVSPDDITVIDGEERDGGGYYRDTSVILTGSRLFLCPERLEG